MGGQSRNINWSSLFGDQLVEFLALVHSLGGS